MYNVNVTFDWDEANIGHVARHDLTQAEVEYVLAGCPVKAGGDERAGEMRFRAVGETPSGRVIVVVYVVRGRSVRPVTAFPANVQIRRWYAKERNKS